MNKFFYIILPLVISVSQGCVVTRAEGNRIHRSLEKLRSEIAASQRANFDRASVLAQRIDQLEASSMASRKGDTKYAMENDKLIEELQTAKGQIEEAKYELSQIKKARPAGAKARRQNQGFPKGKVAHLRMAKKALASKKFDLSAKAFDDFVDNYSKEKKLMPDALLGQGRSYVGLAKKEAHRTRRNNHYKKAILAFQELMTKFPRGRSVDRALFETGQAFEVMGFKKDAVVFYEEVVSKHKKSGLVAPSKRRLAALTPKKTMPRARKKTPVRQIVKKKSVAKRANGK